MDKIKKQHQSEISDKWRLMTNTEKVQFIHMMNQMLSQMESMGVDKHMSKMMGGYDEMKYDGMKHDSKKMKHGSDMGMMMPKHELKSEKSK